MKLNNKVISVTGGSGFIGSQLINRLKNQGNEIRVLSRIYKESDNQIKYFKGDLTENSDNHIIRNFLKGSNILFHCASELNIESKMQSLHIEGTKKLIELSKDQIDKWIQLSSVGAYGQKYKGEINFLTPENPSGLYETTKSKSDHLVKQSGIKYVILRPSIVFGNTMTNRVIDNLAKAIKYKFFFYINKKALMNFVHINDVIEALKLCAYKENAIGNTFILSESLTIQDLVKSLSEGMGTKEPKISIPEMPLRIIAKTFEKFPYFPLTTKRINVMTGELTYDSSLIKTKLGFNFHSNLKKLFYYYAKTIS